eukprot:m.41833 g.41833  ORF g.41833 m.41833 type:complete len:363 (+) comp10617_c0_seq2:215-1303(+)
MDESLAHLVAGVTAGVATSGVLHPFDLIKIRLQVQDAPPSATTTTTPPGARTTHYRGAIHALRTIVKEEGVRALYRGVSPSMLANGVAWGSYFYLYNFLKTAARSDNEDEQLSHVMHLSLATIAGMATMTISNPLWVLKTRMCLETLPLTQSSPGITASLRQLYAKEGMAGLYRVSATYRRAADAIFCIHCLFQRGGKEWLCPHKSYTYWLFAHPLTMLFHIGVFIHDCSCLKCQGILPGYVGTTHGGFQFMAYEELKRILNERKDRPPNAKLSTPEYLGAAMASKVFAGLVTYPYQIVRTRQQKAGIGELKSLGSLDIIKEVYHRNGAAGFYRGLRPYLVRVMPATCSTFLIYEQLQHFLT